MADYSCPICNSSDLLQFVYRQNVPVHQNLLFDSIEDARAASRGRLDMRCCHMCGFVFNAAFDLAKLSYGAQYDNNQCCSSVFQEHFDGLVDYLLNHEKVENCRIVEVGCGQGQFIERLVSEGRGNSGIGYDPSYTGEGSRLDGRLRFEKKYYDRRCAQQPADVVICRHVIEHVEKPLELLNSIREALAQSPGARVYFETPCVELILKDFVIWDFFYEHCSLFSVGSLTAAFELAGFEVSRVRHIFGEQYLWIEARAGEVDSPRFSGGGIDILADSFAREEKTIIQDWSDRIMTLSERGKVALWGAAAKGVTFANLIDPHCSLLDCLVDLNPNKQGRYVAGSGHPIVDYCELEKRNVRSVILMNPNYRVENQTLLSKANFVDVTLVD